MYLDESKCIGCGVCTIICPKKCIDYKEHKNGFFNVEINKSNCTECNLCKQVCPLNKEEKNDKYVGTYAVASRDKDVLYKSASGGVGYELAKYALKNNYKVCGVRYNYDTDRAEHKIYEDQNAINEIRGSKYIPSNTISAFKSLFDGSKYIVFGTPCQIAGIKNLINIKGICENFILVDFFCHGVPSLTMWDKYLIELKSVLGESKLENIVFRDKTYGWHSFTVTASSRNKKYISDAIKDNDNFYRYFLGNYCLNETCYECKFRTLNSSADIRIGDLWGDKYRKDIEGVSGVITLNKKGDKIIKEISSLCKTQEESLDIICEEQMKENITKPECTKNIKHELISKKSLKQIYIKEIIPQKIKNKLLRRI